MRHDIQVLDRIRKTYASLRPSEQRVADYVLNHPETCTQQTISELADQVQVSQPTVVRFVQALGFGGFRNFKYCLLRDRSQGTEREAYFDHLGGFDLKPWDQLEDLPLKEVRVSGGLLEAALKSLSPQELDRAVRMLATARTIDIYGVENSCTPAGDLLTKLTYLGLCCRMNTDAYLQQIGAAHLGVADVAVAFSHSGCSMDTVKALKLAQKAGAGTIAITSRKNPLLARYADVCLCTGGEEAVIYGTAIFSRIPDLAVVDLLYMGIIQSDYERFSRSLDKSGAVIDSISTQSGNTLTVCVGRLTASFHISLAALRQLRAEGIETIAFQTVLCSTTLSVDELLAMGGEDAEVVLTHHIRSSTLTVGGKAV